MLENRRYCIDLDNDIDINVEGDDDIEWMVINSSQQPKQLKSESAKSWRTWLRTRHSQRLRLAAHSKEAGGSCQGAFWVLPASMTEQTTDNNREMEPNRQP